MAVNTFTIRAMLVMLLMCSGLTASAATVRFEAESTGVVKDQGDAVGYDSLDGSVARVVDATASNGELLQTAGNNRNFKMVFVGTGVNLISRQDTDGADYDWILDEGATTGSGTTLGGSRVDQAAFPVVSGLTNTLHTLELRRKNPAAGTFRLRPDAFDVLNADSQTRFEQNNPAISYSASPGWLSTTWTSDRALEEASGGSMALSIQKGATATLNFSGTAVAILADVRGDGGIYSWDINNGLASGVVDLRAQNALLFGNWHRWPILLTNSLAPGSYTLTLTAQEANSGGRGSVTLDAIDVFGVPEPTSLALLGFAVFGIVGLVRRQRH